MRCHACGHRLVQRTASCPGCGGRTPLEFAECIHCSRPLVSAAAPDQTSQAQPGILPDWLLGSEDREEVASSSRTDSLHAQVESAPIAGEAGPSPVLPEWLLREEAGATPLLATVESFLASTATPPRTSEPERIPDRPRTSDAGLPVWLGPREGSTAEERPKKLPARIKVDRRSDSGHDHNAKPSWHDDFPAPPDPLPGQTIQPRRQAPEPSDGPDAETPTREEPLPVAQPTAQPSASTPPGSPLPTGPPSPSTPPEEAPRPEIGQLPFLTATPVLTASAAVPIGAGPSVTVAAPAIPRKATPGAPRGRSWTVANPLDIFIPRSGWARTAMGAIILAVALAAGIGQVEPIEYLPGPDVARAFGAINHVPAGTAALIAVEYGDRSKDQVEPAARLLMDQLRSKGISLVIASTNASSLARGRAVAPQGTAELGVLDAQNGDIPRLGQRQQGSRLPAQASLLKASGGKPVELLIVVADTAESAGKWLNDYRKTASPPGIAILGGGDSFALSPLLKTGQVSGILIGNVDVAGYRTLAGGGIPPQRVGGSADGVLLSLGMLTVAIELAWWKRRGPRLPRSKQRPG